MTQTWEHLLFANWPLPPESIRHLIPDELEVDTFQGQSWISIIPFRMSRIRIKCMPVIPFTSTFPEINVRTYVKENNKSGVFFITLDASNPFVTMIAKLWYRLPYFHAKMTFLEKNQHIEFNSRRDRSSEIAEEFIGSYRPISQPFYAESGTIEHWLTERYTLYCKCSRSNNIYWESSISCEAKIDL